MTAPSCRPDYHRHPVGERGVKVRVGSGDLFADDRPLRTLALEAGK